MVEHDYALSKMAHLILCCVSVLFSFYLYLEISLSLSYHLAWGRLACMDHIEGSEGSHLGQHIIAHILRVLMEIDLCKPNRNSVDITTLISIEHCVCSMFPFHLQFHYYYSLLIFSYTSAINQLTETFKVMF